MELEKMEERAEGIVKLEILGQLIDTVQHAPMTVERKNGQDQQIWNLKLNELQLALVYTLLRETESKTVLQYGKDLRDLSRGNA